MDVRMPCLGASGLERFQALQPDAVSAVTERFYAIHGSAYERFGPRGRIACKEDLGLHLEFLRPVLEFGLLQPMVDYLTWLGSVLEARAIPAEHLGQSLEWLGEFYAERMQAADGVVVSVALLQAREKFLEAKAVPVAAPTPPEAWADAAAFEAALLAGDQREATAVVYHALDGGHTLVDVELHVIQTALYHIGELWQANRVTVAQEHMASAIVQSVMTLSLLRSTPPPLTDQRVLLACVQTNIHAIGLRMVADAFQLTGWDVQYLGANVPTPAIVQQVADWKPALLALSVSFAQQLPAAKDVIAQLDTRPGFVRPAVIVGGLAINRFSQLAQFAGADSGCADASAALAYANRLVRV